MSEKHPIDELFRSGLDEQGATYSDAHWQAMEQMLEGKKRGFFAVYRVYLISALLLLLLGLGYWLIPGEQSGVVTPKPLTQQTDLKENTLQEESRGSTTEAISDTDQEEVTLTDVSAEELQLSLNSTAPTVAAAGVSSIDGVLPVAAQSEQERGHGQEQEQEQENVVIVDDEREVTRRAFNRMSLSSRTIDGFNVLDFLKIPLRANEQLAQPMEFKARKLAWYISPYGRFDNYNRDISGLSDASQKLNEKTMNSWNYGVHVGIGKGDWIFRSGLEYTGLREQTNYETVIDNWSYDSTLVIKKSSYTETPRGTRVAILGYDIDSTLSQERFVDCPDCEVQFNYLTIPVNAQYNLGLGRHSIFAEAGIRYSFLLSASGKYSTNPEQGVSSSMIDLSTTDVLERSLLSAQVGLGYKYHLNHRLALTGALQMSTALGSMFSNYDHAVRLNGMRVGLEWRVR